MAEWIDGREDFIERTLPVCRRFAEDVYAFTQRDTDDVDAAMLSVDLDMVAQGASVEFFGGDIDKGWLAVREALGVCWEKLLSEAREGLDS